MSFLTRRRALVATGASLLLPACSRVSDSDPLTLNASFQRVLGWAQTWTLASQRFLLAGGQLAPEYAPAEVSRVFKANGTLHPAGDDYARHLSEGFANWRLTVDGLVAHPLSLSVQDLRALPARTQITRHDCVEGWSAIGGWTGVPLGLILKAAAPTLSAKYAVLYCADNLDGEPAKGGQQAPGQYYESIALIDAVHPQTLIAYALNGQPLDVAHGAPLRLRVERQLGYKQAKYVQRIELVSRLDHINGGRGGYWEDRGYDWYAGI